MNDFLTRLAQRSMGVAPLIAPRLPGLFAPVEETQIDNFATTKSVMSAGKTAVMTSATGAARNPTLVSPSVQPRTAAHADPATSESRSFVYPPHRPPEPEAANAPAPVAYIESISPRVASAHIPLVETSQANFQTTAPLPAPAASHPVAAPEPLIAPRKQETPAVAAQQWLPLLPRRKADSVAPFPAMADTAMRADTGTAPTVHITIGRVEVKANIATPTAAPRPRTASKPMLSLGDFLKRGAGAS